MPVLFLDIIATFTLQVSHTPRGRRLCLALTAENISVRKMLPRCVIKPQATTSHTSTLLLIKTTCKPGWEPGFFWLYSL